MRAAIAMLLVATAAHADGPDPPELPSLHAARDAYLAGRYAEAIALARAQKEPDWLIIGWSACAIGDLDLVIDAMKHHSPPYDVERCVAELLRKRKYRDVLVIARARVDDNDAPIGWYWMARASCAIGDKTRAEEAYRHVLPQRRDAIWRECLRADVRLPRPDALPPPAPIRPAPVTPTTRQSTAGSI